MHSTAQYDGCEVEMEATRALHNELVAVHVRGRRSYRVAVVGTAFMGVVFLAGVLLGNNGAAPRSALSLSITSLQELPAGNASAGAGPAPIAAPAFPLGAGSDENPVDCSGEPGGCMGTSRASRTILPLAIFALIGACLFWSYRKFVSVPGFTEAREKKIKTVVFSPARRAYDTFGHEVAGPV